MYTFQSGNGSRHHLVEDVVRSLQRLLGNDTSFLQQVGLNISTSQLSRSGEMDTDEFTLLIDENQYFAIFYSIFRALTKREELSLRTVLALPKASRTGLVWTTWSSRDPLLASASVGFLVDAPIVAKYAITFLVFSVFPAPVSLEMISDKFKSKFYGVFGNFYVGSFQSFNSETYRILR